jgi:hypothetical protein
MLCAQGEIHVQPRPLLFVLSFILPPLAARCLESQLEQNHPLISVRGHVHAWGYVDRQHEFPTHTRNWKITGLLCLNYHFLHYRRASVGLARMSFGAAGFGGDATIRQVKTASGPRDFVNGILAGRK